MAKNFQDFWLLGGIIFVRGRVYGHASLFEFQPVTSWGNLAVSSYELEDRREECLQLLKKCMRETLSALM